MRQKSVHPESPSERIVKNIRRATRKRHSSEEKIRIVLDGLRGESSIAELCRREGIAEGLYYAWSKEFLEAGKRRLAGDTARAATSGEVKDLRRQAQELKAVVAEQPLELRLNDLRAPNKTYDNPSAFNASCTFGRAFMRSMKALTFGKGERSNSTRGAQRVTV
jgi:transposase